MTMLEMQDKLAAKYHYSILPEAIRWKYRKLYLEHLPAPFFEWMSCGKEGYPLFSKAGNCIARGFSRVVVGDYGAFVEIPSQFLFQNVLTIKPGTEKRLTLKNAKYNWLCPRFPDGRLETECKVYEQKKRVSYADYKEGLYYISPYHLQYVTEDCMPSAKEIENVIEGMQKAAGIACEQLSML